MFSNEASVVDLPEPVGPVTRMRPRGLNSRSLTDSGRPICSKVSILLGIWRSTMPKLPFSLKTLTRNRAASPKAKAKSAPPRSRTCWMCSSEVMLRISSSEVSGVSAGPSTRCKIPWTRIVGAVPTRVCKSEAPSETTNCNRSDIE